MNIEKVNNEGHTRNRVNTMSKIDLAGIIKIAIAAITLIIIVGMIESCVVQESRDSIERQKYMTPAEKCIGACKSATSGGSVLERDCINQCFKDVNNEQNKNP